MQSWANRGFLLLPPRKKTYQARKKNKRDKSPLSQKEQKKTRSFNYILLSPPPPTSRPHPPRHPLLMPLIPPPNPAPPIIKSHILPLNPNPPRLTDPSQILYNLMSAQSQIQRKTTLHNPPQNTTFAQNFPINQSLLIPREIFFHHCQFGCGEEVRFGNDDERRIVRGGFVFEM